MGTEGFGVLVFNIPRKLWTRFDRAAEPVPSRYMDTIFYADEDYIFGGSLQVYSRKLKRWLKVEAIPTRYVRSFGYSGPYVQAPWSLTQFAKEKYLPLTPYPYNMALSWPKELRLRDDGAAYIFTYEPDDAPTEFIIEKWQLEWAFSQITMNQAPQQQSLR